MRTELIALAIIAALLPVSGCIGNEEIQLGKAPDFSILDMDGNEFSLNSTVSNANATIIHLITIGCHDAVFEKDEKEFSAIRQILSNATNGVEIRAISITSSLCNTTNLTGIRESHNITWTFANDYPELVVYGNDSYYQIFRSFGSPTIIILDDEMNMRYASGYADLETLQEEVSAIINGSEKSGESVFLKNDSASALTMFLLGIATSLSPCAISFLVALMVYIGNVAEKRNKNDGKRKKAAYGASLGISFVIGMALVFFVIGCFTSYIGFFTANAPIFNLIAGIVLILLGINIIRPFSLVLEPILSRFGRKEPAEKQNVLKNKILNASPILGAFILGVLFTIGWAPCAISFVLPIMVIFLTQKLSVLAGGLLFLIFGIGHGVPVIPLAVGTTTMKAKIGNIMAKYGKWISIIFCIFVVSFGVLMIARYFGIYLW